MTELPDGWTEASLGAVTQPITDSVKPAEADPRSFLGMEDVEPESTKILGTQPAAGIRSNTRPFFLGDTLYGRLRPYLNKVCTPDFEGLASAEFMVFRPSPSLVPGFLKYFLNSQSFVRFACSVNDGDRPRVKWNQIEAFPLLLPPLTEQGRIVDAIKEIFTRLDVIEPALEGLLERLGVLRSAILADTFHANRDLPDGWEETTLEDLAASAKRSITDGPFGSNLKTSHYTDSGPRVIRLQNIGEGCFIDVHAHISEDHYRRLVAHNVLAEDLVVASLFSDRFRSCLIPEHVPPAIVKADCIRIRLSQEINPRFVNYALMRPAVDAYAVRSVHGVGRSRLGMKGVKSIPVPLPPHAEQQRIVEYIDAAFSRVDALDAAARSLLKRIGVFRQSILAEAFAGRLVSQDPADEPASAFLERIQADRETGPKKRGKVKA